MKVTKDTPIYDILVQKPEAIGVLMSFGMGCVMCPASQMESIEQACMVHGMDYNILVEAINNIDDTQYNDNDDSFDDYSNVDDLDKIVAKDIEKNKEDKEDKENK